MRSPVTLVGYFVPSLGRLVPLLALLLLAGQAIAGQVFIDEGRGNVAVQFPDSYDPAIPAPLIVALHAYHSGGGSAITQYLQLTQIQEVLFRMPPRRTTQFGEHLLHSGLVRGHLGR